ncbi:MAG: hypothetical protein ABSC29_01325 [Minisyncoccia bacterium]
MTDETRIELIHWPGGFITRAGGTRTGVKLNRPWQVPLVQNEFPPELFDRIAQVLPPDFFETDSATSQFGGREAIRGLFAAIATAVGEAKKSLPPCALCKKYVTASPVTLAETVPPGWKVVRNDFTPHYFHILVIPAMCWEEEVLRRLGGREKIEEMLRAAMSVVWSGEAADMNFWLGVHVGYLAGQNFPHPHMHELQTSANPPHVTRSLWEELRNLQTDERVVAETPKFVVSAGGLRAGQLLIMPKSFMPMASHDLIAELAELLDKIVTLCGNKFRSIQGLPPDFHLSLGFCNGNFQGGEYVPRLNNRGFTESYPLTFGLADAIPFILPWPHWETAAYLKS